MKRFKEFITEAPTMYHGSVHDFDKPKVNRDEFMMDRAVGMHFAADHTMAKKFAGGLYKNDNTTNGGHMYKAKAPPDSQVEKVPQKRYYKGKPGSHPRHGLQSDQDAISTHIAATVFSKPEHKELFKSWLKTNRHVDDDTAEQVHAHLSAGKAPANPEKFGMAAHKGNSFHSYMRNFGSGLHVQPYEGFKKEVVHHFLNHMKSKGIKALSYVNTSPMETQDTRSPKSYILLHPEDHHIEKHS